MDRILHFNMRKDAALRESYHDSNTRTIFVGSAFGIQNQKNIRLAKYLMQCGCNLNWIIQQN